VKCENRQPEQINETLMPKPDFPQKPTVPESNFISRNPVPPQNFPRQEEFIEPVKKPQLPSSKPGFKNPDDLCFDPVDAWNHIHVSEYSVDTGFPDLNQGSGYPDDRISEKIRVHLVRSGPGQKPKQYSQSMTQSAPEKQPIDLQPLHPETNGYQQHIPNHNIFLPRIPETPKPNSQQIHPETKTHDWIQKLETQLETTIARTDKGIQQFRDKTLQRNQQQFSSQPLKPTLDQQKPAAPAAKNVHSVKPFLYVLRKTEDTELINIDQINHASNYPFAQITKYYDDREMEFTGAGQQLDFPPQNYHNDGSNNVYPKTQVDDYRSFQFNVQNEPIYVPKPDYELDYGIYYRGNRPLPNRQQVLLDNYRSINNNQNLTNNRNDGNYQVDNRQYGLQPIYNKSNYENQPNFQSEKDLVYNEQASFAINGNQFKPPVRNQRTQYQNYGYSNQKIPHHNQYNPKPEPNSYPIDNSNSDIPLGYRNYPRLPRVTFDPDHQVINPNMEIPDKFIANSPTMQTKQMHKLPSHPWSYRYNGGTEINHQTNRQQNPVDAYKYTNNFSDSLMQDFEPVRPASYRQYDLNQNGCQQMVDQKWARRGFPESYDLN